MPLHESCASTSFESVYQVCKQVVYKSAFYCSIVIEWWKNFVRHWWWICCGWKYAQGKSIFFCLKTLNLDIILILGWRTRMAPRGLYWLWQVDGWMGDQKETCSWSWLVYHQIRYGFVPDYVQNIFKVQLCFCRYSWSNQRIWCRHMFLWRQFPTNISIQAAVMSPERKCWSLKILLIKCHLNVIWLHRRI